MVVTFMDSSKTHIRILFNAPHADVDQLWIYYAAKPALSSYTNLVIFSTVTQYWKPTTGYRPLIHRRICCHLKNLSYMQLHSNGPNSSLLHIIESNSSMYQILWCIEFYDAYHVIECEWWLNPQKFQKSPSPVPPGSLPDSPTWAKGSGITWHGRPHLRQHW